MEIRKCRYCGLQLQQKEYEHLHAFIKRVYCDTKCALNDQRKRKHWRDNSWPDPRFEDFK